MDPRIERTRTAVMDAAVELLLQRGPDAVTMDGVVARSGVAKSTLYRHWPTRDALLTSVFHHLAPSVPAPDPTLGFVDALRSLVRSLAEILSDERWTPLIPALILLKAQHPDMAQLEAELNAQQGDVLIPVLAKGVAEGLVRDDLAAEVASTLLVGPLLMGALTGSVALDEPFADAVVDQFLAGAAPR
jgi:AcrR family transcriptional regulator